MTHSEPLDMLEQEIQRCEHELAGLRRARALFAAPPPAPPPPPKRTAAALPPPAADAPPATNGRKHGSRPGKPLVEWRRLVAQYIRLNGPARSTVAIAALEMPQSTFWKVVDHEWFIKESDGYHLTNEALRALAGKSSGDDD